MLRAKGFAKIDTQAKIPKNCVMFCEKFEFSEVFEILIIIFLQML